jgi:hypothetical protein
VRTRPGGVSCAIATGPPRPHSGHRWGMARRTHSIRCQRRKCAPRNRSNQRHTGAAVIIRTQLDQRFISNGLLPKIQLQCAFVKRNFRTLKGDGITHAQQALTQRDSQSLFAIAVSEHEKDAIAAMGPAWTRMGANRHAQVAVLDMFYNLGQVRFAEFEEMKLALQSPDGPDYVRAGFQIVNAKRARQLPKRTEGDYQNMLYLSKSELGNFVVQ